jgi:hypothetical protein
MCGTMLTCAAHLLQATTDFSKFDPVPHKTTLHLVNNFVLQTTRFLNRFSNICEEKLAVVAKDIQSLEISLSIIESKLQIEGLDDPPPGVCRHLRPLLVAHHQPQHQRASVTQ